MDAIIIIIVFTSICTILSLGVGIASYLKYKQNLKYNPDLEYISFLKNAVNTTVSLAPAPAPALNYSRSLYRRVPTLTPTPALTLIPDSLPAPALTPVSTPAPVLTPESPPVSTPAPTTQAPAPVPVAENRYISLSGYEAAGNDITYFENATYNTCRTECNNRADCKGFNLDTDAVLSTGGRGTCYLKSKVHNVTKKNLMHLFKRTDKVLSGNEGETAKFGCAVDTGILRFGDADAKVYEYSLDDQANDIETNLDNIKKIGGTFKQERDQSLIGKWKANYICKTPVQQGYTVEGHIKLGGDVLWENQSATFAECKTKCDDYGDQCQVFNISTNISLGARRSNSSEIDRNTKGECSLRSSRDKNTDTKNSDYDVYEKIKVGQTLVCSGYGGYDPKGTPDSSAYYRYMGNNKMRWYPSDDILKSWDPKYDEIYYYSDCIGFELGEDMKRKS